MTGHKILTLTIVTFISNNENFNCDILRFYVELKKILDYVELIVFSEHENLEVLEVHDANIKEIVCPNTTKYKRILASLQIANSEAILYIDNDILPKFSSLYKFISDFDDNVDLYFGRISVKEPITFVEKLIQIDKTLSHKFIRPLLWRLNIGISVPGQIFMLRRAKFANNLDVNDTVFDDLAIGICANENKYNVQVSNAVLGEEKAKPSFRELLKQRKRWAQGYYESLLRAKGRKIFNLVAVHGATYHLLGISFLLLIYFLYAVRFEKTAIGLILLISWYISDFCLLRIPYAIAYLFIFPAIHLIWLCHLVRHLICALKFT